MLLSRLVIFLRAPTLPRASRTLLLLSLLSAQAGAHAFLVDTDPRGGARKPVAPPQILLRFSEPFVPDTQQVKVRAGDGQEVPLPPAQQISGGRELMADLPPLQEGVYVVEWQVLASDGHLSAGEFAFGVGEAGAVSTDALSNAQSVPWKETAASALLFVGLSLALGGLVSQRFVWRDNSLRVPRPLVTLGLGLAALGAAVQLALLFTARGAFDLPAWSGVMSVHAGRIAFTILLLASAALLLRGWWRFAVVLAAVVTASLAGHAGQQGGWQVPLVTVHFLAGAVWLGALVHLVQVLVAVRRAGWQPRVSSLVSRYSRLVGWTLAPLLIAGVLLAVPQFTRPAEVLETAYGRLLLAKLAAVLVVLLLALIARLRTLPVDAARLKLLRTLTGAEALLLVGVVLLSASLVNASPPRSLANAYTLGAPPIEGPAIRFGDVAGLLTVFAAAAEDQLQVQVVAPLGKPAEDARVSIEGTRPGGKGLTLYPRSCGRGCFEVKYDWPEGTTRLSIQASHPEWQGGQVKFEVPWPPSPDATRRLEQVVETLRGEGEIVVHELARSGPNQASYSFPIQSKDVLAADAYAGGGAVDVRVLPSGDKNLTRLSFFVPGSNLWYEFWVSDDNRVRRQVVVAPGNWFDRTIEYPDER